MKCELINYQLLANKLFDMSVLVGIRHAVTNLQMAIYSQGCHDIIVDDNYKYIRSLTLEWDDAIVGCRITITELP